MGRHELRLGRRGHVVYATHGLTTHDRRFVEVMTTAGWDVDYMRFDGGSQSLEQRAMPSSVRLVDWLGSRDAFCEERRGEFIDAMSAVVDWLAPDLVHAGPIPTVGHVAASASDCPVVLMSWGSDLLVDVDRSPVMSGFARAAIAGGSATIVDCETVAAAARSLGADPTRMLVIPWGVDLAAFPYRLMMSPSEPLRLLSLRSLEPLYDVATALRAVAQVNDDLGAGAIELTVAGSGSLASDLRVLASTLGIGDLVSWVGRVEETDVAALLGEHHIHLSTATTDGSSVSLLQALATGRPSIVTDIPSNREWIRHGEEGWLFRPEDSASLAQVIIQARSERDALADMGVRGRAVAEARADWAGRKREIIELYERCAS